MDEAVHVHVFSLNLQGPRIAKREYLLPKERGSICNAYLEVAGHVS